jgi:hypothetical protein
MDLASHEQAGTPDASPERNGIAQGGESPAKDGRWMMRRRMGSLAAGGLAIGAAGCVLPLNITIGDDGTHIRGSGHVVTVSRNVGSFDAIVASGASTVVVERTGAEGVEVTAEDNLLPYLETEVQGGVLYVGFTEGVNLSPREEIFFHVESYEVVEVDASGAVSMELDVGWVPQLWVTLSGASHLLAWGEADEQDVSVSGASRYDALDLQTRWTRIDASGASLADVWVRETLDVVASGASHVRFRGSPDVRADVSGASTVTRY